MEQKTIDLLCLSYAKQKTAYACLALSNAGDPTKHMGAPEEVRSYAEGCYRRAVEALSEVSDETPEIKERAVFLEGIIKGIARERLQVIL